MRHKPNHILLTIALSFSTLSAMAQSEPAVDRQYTPEIVKNIQDSFATVICSGCNPGVMRVPVDSKGANGAQVSLTISWLAGKYWTFSGQKTAVEFPAEPGHVYMIQRGTRPDREFEGAPAHEECMLVVDWSASREFVSCEPYTFKKKKGAIKPPVDRSTGENTTRLICSGCLFVGAGPDKKDLYSDVTLDAGDVTMGIYPWLGAIRGPGLQFSLNASPGHTYIVLWNIAFLPVNLAKYHPELKEEDLLRVMLKKPSERAKEKHGKTPFLSDCALVVDATEDWSVVTCSNSAGAKGMRADFYPGDWDILEKVHAELLESWGL